MDDAALPSPTSRRPLSYTPYQSHRRTNSQRSNASTPGPATPASPAPVASFSSSGASSSSTILARPAPANNASSSSLRPSSTVIEPSPLRNSLPEPPPLRRLNAKPDKHTPAPAPTLTLQPAQPVAEREDDTPKATSPPPRSPARIDSPPLNGPPQRKAISTSQALRMRDHGRAAGLDSSAASTTSSDNTPRTQSPVPPSPATSAHPRIAYTQPRHAFQPRGVSRSQLVEFVEAKARVAKKKKSSSKKKNGVAKLAAQNGDEDAQRTEERIRRRVEKLVTLHYPSTSTETAAETEPSLPSSSSSSSLLSSALFTTLAPHSRFLTTLRQSSALRAAEQALVPWQPDEEVQACPICGGAFAAGVGSKGVGRRRHHCRACGRVVCASPDVVARGARSKPDQLDNDSSEGRRQALVFGGKCSGTVVLDEASLDVAAGETRLTIKDLVAPDGGAEDSFEAFLKQQRSKDQSKGTGGGGGGGATEGFRLCRDCRQIVLRGQYMDEEANAPTYVRLYDELTALQREIETTLPAFQELVMGLQKSNGDVASTIDDTTPQPSAREAKIQLQLQRDAARARKGLLANFAKYDALAKRIRDLPYGDDVGLKRLKENVFLRAGAFLQTNMFPLQSLPKIDSTPRAHGRLPSSSTSASVAASPHLAVLQEQRSQIAHFLDCANRERKLNDAASLRRNLEELDAEIAKLSVAGGGAAAAAKAS